ncbi:uncharacterized protein LOC124169703 [Ischnura elegans]|uniref:uncharacterized protein LOC124169703 n=1 Tax=Ischnura elegans TaxID=197161 RepID=UPI001ED8B1F2|nr:uncharacterized protein LOC124169703 [Ischnura elegans]
MDAFLTPFVEKMNLLLQDGINTKRSGRIINVKVLTLCCCVDTVARAEMQCIVGHNGYNCCSWCLIQGENVNGTVKFPIPDDIPRDRTERHYKKCYTLYAKGNKKSNVEGIKGISPLVNLISFRMVWGFVPDYMHCVLQGVTKRWIRLWMNNVDKQYYIGDPKNIGRIDDRMKRIRPPTLLKRLPFLMKNSKDMRKARELENWLLFYSVPVLSGILPGEILKHWKLLVSAMHLLLQDSVPVDTIHEDELLLIEFVCKTQLIYVKGEMTYNVHQLLHLAESVRKWGPLWSHTAFPFENAIGVLKRVVKGARGIPHQVTRSLELKSSREIMMSSGFCGSEVVDFCESITVRDVNKSYRLAEGTFFGKPSDYFDSVDGLQENQTYTQHRKVIRNDVIYERFVDGDTRRFDNSYVELNNGDFAHLMNILLCKETSECHVIIKILNCHAVEGLRHLRIITGIQPEVACKFSMVKNVAIFIDVLSEQYVASVPSCHYKMNL